MLPDRLARPHACAMRDRTLAQRCRGADAHGAMAHLQHHADQPAQASAPVDDFERTLASLGALLATMRTLEAGRDADVHSLRREVAHMSAREQELGAAIQKLKSSVSMPAAINEHADTPNQGAGHTAPATGRPPDPASLNRAAPRVSELEAQLAAVTRERDRIARRLFHHEECLKAAGLEIQWASHTGHADR